MVQTLLIYVYHFLFCSMVLYFIYFNASEILFNGFIVHLFQLSMDHNSQLNSVHTNLYIFHDLAVRSLLIECLILSQ